nr:MAG TPA: hypothetical protein [Caudoviricetes sp.]
MKHSIIVFYFFFFFSRGFFHVTKYLGNPL